MESNNSSHSQFGETHWDDATMLIISSYIIFTMQSGFGLLESGCLAFKNEVNIMFKGAVDVIFGGCVYWLVGFGLAFGNDAGTNAFCSFGYWALVVHEEDQVGDVYIEFLFQLSFASTAATIVSGAMAGRVRLHSYIIYAAMNNFIYCFPSHWVWHSKGFLRQLGVVDIAGSGVVHMVGGTSALVAAIMLGPRRDRFDGKPPHIGNGTNMILGAFFLWWGWIGYSSGSVLGIRQGKWVSATRAAVCTIVSSMGGGIAAVAYSLKMRGYYSVVDLVTGVIASLVSISSGCGVVQPWEAFIIGSIGAIIGCSGLKLFDYLQIDDPAGATSIHGLSSIWSMLSVGLFMNEDPYSGLNLGNVGLFHGGGFYSLGVQALGVVCIMPWAFSLSFLFTLLMKISPLGLRVPPEEELRGSDFWEHALINKIEQKRPFKALLQQIVTPSDEAIILDGVHLPALVAVGDADGPVHTVSYAGPRRSIHVDSFGGEVHVIPEFRRTEAAALEHEQEQEVEITSKFMNESDKVKKVIIYKKDDSGKEKPATSSKDKDAVKEKSKLP